MRSGFVARGDGAPSLELADGFPDDLAGWSQLALEGGNVFLTPEWALTWHEHLGRGRRVVSASARDADGRLRALALLSLSGRRPFRTARFVGHGPADELGLLCRPEERAQLTAGLLRLVHEHRLADVFVAEQLAGDLDWPELLGGSLVDRIGSPVLRLDYGGWDALLASRSSKLRHQVRRDERRLRENGATIRLASDPERFDADFESFLALHREHFGKRSGFLEGRADFHGAFARLALERGWARLWLLESDGRAEAGWYGLRFGGADGLYQSGRSIDSTRGAGIVLLATMIRNALEDGVREFRFLRGSEAYKYRWTDEDAGLLTVAAATGGATRLAVGLARRRRLPHQLAGRASRRLLLA